MTTALSHGTFAPSGLLYASVAGYTSTSIVTLTPLTPSIHALGATFEIPSSQTQRFELDGSVSSLCWIAAPVVKTSKRKQNGLAAKVATQEYHLVVAHTAGISVYSQYSDKPLANHALSGIRSITGSTLAGCVWILAEKVFQYNTLTETITDEFAFKKDEEVLLIQVITLGDEEHLALCSDKLSVVSPASPLKPVYSTRKNKAHTQITSVAQNGSVLYVTRKDAAETYQVDLSGKQKVVFHSETPSTVSVVEINGVSLVATLSASTIEFFDTASVAQISADCPCFAGFHAFDSKIITACAIGNSVSFVVGAFTEGKTALECKSSSGVACCKPNGSKSVSAPETATPSSEIDIPMLLMSLTPANVSSLVASSQSEDAVREMVSGLTSAQAVQLFAALGGLVETPARSADANVWLKWTLLAHGGYIAHQPEMASVLAAVQASLARGAKELRATLGLQGRLEFLKSQLALRNEIAAANEADDEADEVAVVTEDTIVYVNGEIDEAVSEDEEDEEDEE